MVPSILYQIVNDPRGYYAHFISCVSFNVPQYLTLNESHWIHTRFTKKEMLVTNVECSLTVLQIINDYDVSGAFAHKWKNHNPHFKYR